MSGALYIVATPIGNLKDITFRAVEILRDVDLIAAEDTRHTRILLEHYSISTPTTSYFQHNEKKKGEYILRLLKEGKNIALVSDAGTPGINDPGYSIIKTAIENNIAVIPIPGACAFILGLVTSGFPTDRFVFEGFLPHKSGTRKNRLKEMIKEDRTVIFYESPHRLVKTLQDMLDVFGDINIALARELTKKFEDIQHNKISIFLEYFNHNRPRGEFVVVFNVKTERFFNGIQRE